MSTAFDEEKQEFVQEPAELSSPVPDREFTLSTTTLLVIFFGLVMVCGLFFGLGYTFGRHETGGNTALGPNAIASTTALGGHAKPSANVQNSTQTETQAQNQANSPEPIEARSAQDAPVPQPVLLAASEQSAPAGGTVQPALPQVSNAAATPAPKASTASPAAQLAAQPAADIMVQIAAVSDQNDANVLLSALRKRGYSVTVRHESGDSLMHVQVGPFANAADAKAMRQKLLSDGYNAIIR